MSTQTQSKQTRFTAAYMARIAILGAISAILYVFPEIPVIPPIFKLDFSTFPALLAGFSLGPVGGLLVIAVKDLTGLTHTSSMGIGELADLLMSGAFVMAASMVYARRKTFKGAVTGMALGTLAITLMGVLANYFIMIPFYGAVFNMTNEMIIGMVQKTIPAVDNMWKLILLAVVPFNILKGIALSAVTVLTYKRLSPLLHVNKG